ncbi:hypothetical protein JCM3770_001610 [Rhodotorula araucariae]
MASSAPGASHSLVSPAAYLHLAPSYAAPPASGSSPAASSGGSPSKPIPGAPPSPVRPFAPDELRKLVLEYLCNRCYVDSARAFARELAGAAQRPSGDDDADISAGVATASAASMGEHALGEAMEGVEGTPEPSLAPAGDGPADLGAAPPLSNGKSVAFLDGGDDEDDDDSMLEGSLLLKDDLRDARLRQTIRDAILNGRISHAIDLLNEHYPSVLTSPLPPPPPPSSPSKLAPSNPLSPKHARCAPETFFVAPSPAAPSSTSPGTKPLIGARFEAHAQSLAPAILSLNLQTQVFVELMRSAYATSAHSTPSTPTPSLNGGGGSGANGGSDADMSASTSSLGTFTILNVAIAQAQALAEKVSLLAPGREREGWEKERVDVSALLAYKNVESCEVRGYFEEGRKAALAEMVNAAILQHSGRTALPLLELAARQATAFWATLREMNMPFPPPAPAGRMSDSGNGNGGKGKPLRTLPAFDLHSFLHERDPSPHSADGDTEMR